MVRFLVHFTASRSPGTEDEADEFCENFLGFLLNLATAKDRAIRFRVCQLVAGVLNALGVEAEISDDLYERITRRKALEALSIFVPEGVVLTRCLQSTQKLARNSLTGETARANFCATLRGAS